jgi:hypothetical protein
VTTLDLKTINVRRSKCRECEADIFFAKTPNDKSVPLDIVPAEDGAYVLVAGEPGEPIELEKFDADRHAGRARYTSHFKTCSNPSRFSKRKKREGH